MSASEIQESVKAERQSLQTLQQNVAGKKSKRVKRGPDSPAEPVKRKFSTKKVQTDLDPKVTVDDLTNPDGASENYWKILAEKRRVALDEALVENEKLHKTIEDLKQELEQHKQMLEEANSFVEVIKEELNKNNDDDTGIDINDVSTADETTEDVSETKSKSD